MVYGFQEGPFLKYDNSTGAKNVINPNKIFQKTVTFLKIFAQLQ